MAISNVNNDNNNAQRTKATHAQGSISDFQSLFTSPASFNQAGELLKQFTESFDEAVGKIGNTLIKSYRVLPIDTTAINGTVQLIALYSQQQDSL